MVGRYGRSMIYISIFNHVFHGPIANIGVNLRNTQESMVCIVKMKTDFEIDFIEAVHAPVRRGWTGMLMEMTEVDRMKKQTAASMKVNSLLPVNHGGDDFEVTSYRELMVNQCHEHMETAGQKCRSVMTEHFIQKICYGDILNRLKTGDFTGGTTSPWWMLLMFIPGVSFICHGVMAQLRSKCDMLRQVYRIFSPFRSRQHLIQQRQIL